MEITSGIIKSAQKVVIYGPEGIGKTTFASQFPDPVFIDTEGSTKKLDVRRFPAPENWEDVEAAVDYVSKNPTCCKTLVIDTADWAEVLCTEYTCRKCGVKNIEDVGYGKGYVYMLENWQNLLIRLEKDVVKKGINIVITAHAKMRKFEQPDEMGAYDRWEMKLSKQNGPALKEWADMVLFANYKTFVIEDSKTKSKKAQGGKRVIYTTHNPCWDAKNRDGLEECLPFEYKAVKKAIEGSTEAKRPEKKPEPVKAEPKEVETAETKQAAETEEKSEAAAVKGNEKELTELKKLMERDGITKERLEFAVASKGMYFTGDFEEYDAEFIRKSLIEKWSGFCKYAMRFSEEELKMDNIPFR